MRLLNADASCCTSTRIAGLIGRGGPSKAISPASDGWQGMDIGTCFDTVGRAESRNKAYGLKFAEPRLYTDPDAAARKLVEIASTIEPGAERPKTRACTHKRLAQTGKHLLSLKLLLLTDSVEKVLCGVHTYFLRATGALDTVRHGGPRQSTLGRSAIFLALP
jgi:hypothetical protein